MYNSDAIISILHISKLYNLPPDISFLIYNNLINLSAQLIIDKWFSFLDHMSFATRVASLADTLSIPRELGAGLILKAALEAMGLQWKTGATMSDVLTMVEDAHYTFPIYLKLLF